MPQRAKSRRADTRPFIINELAVACFTTGLVACRLLSWPRDDKPFARDRYRCRRAPPQAHRRRSTPLLGGGVQFGRGPSAGRRRLPRELAPSASSRWREARRTWPNEITWLVRQDGERPGRPHGGRQVQRTSAIERQESGVSRACVKKSSIASGQK